MARQEAAVRWPIMVNGFRPRPWPIREQALTLAAVIGASSTLVLLYLRLARSFPPQDVLAYLRGGSDLVAGQVVYTSGVNTDLAFLYGPPWAIAFGLVSWLPAPILALGIAVADVFALRYVAGSWRGVGIIGLCPLVAFEIAGGNINILLAAALVAGARGHMGPTALFAVAKLSPAILVLGPRGDWRRFAAWGLLLVVVTLPWWHLWPEWFAFLAAQRVPEAAGPVAVGLVPRIPLAVACLLVRRPWSVALAAILFLPVLWWGSLVLLIAPARLLLDAPGTRWITRKHPFDPSRRCDEVPVTT
jgi:hypothetical protein